MCLAVYLVDGTRISGREDVFELEQLGVRIRDHDSIGRRTGGWELLPWPTVKRIVRYKERRR